MDAPEKCLTASSTGATNDLAYHKPLPRSPAFWVRQQGILFADPGAYLSVDPTWTPPSGKTYGLRDLVRYACGA